MRFSIITRNNGNVTREKVSQIKPKYINKINDKFGSINSHEYKTTISIALHKFSPLPALIFSTP